MLAGPAMAGFARWMEFLPWTTFARIVESARNPRDSGRIPGDLGRIAAEPREPKYGADLLHFKSHGSASRA